MDTKLRNRHRRSVFLFVVVVIIAAAVMVGLYPYFKLESKLNENPAYQEQAFLRHLSFGNYVLNLEQKQSVADDIVSPFRCYFPKADEELQHAGESGASEVAEGENEAALLQQQEVENRLNYLRQLRQETMEEYENWNRYFSSIRSFVDYQVLGEDGSVLTDHADGRNIVSDESYVFKAVLHYDGTGRMDVVKVNGENTSYLLRILQEFGDVDPLENVYWDQYRYETGLTMENPKNTTFAYGMTEQQLTAYTEERGDMSWGTIASAMSSPYMGLICTVAILAFLLSFSDVKWAEDNKLFRAPVEIVFLAGMGAISFGFSLSNLVVMTNKGMLYGHLRQANFLPEVAEVMVRLWNVMWWCVPFAVVYWAVICLRDVFHIGLWRYMKERTICGWLYCWCRCKGKQIYAFIGSIDLQEKSQKAIFKIVGVNFIILMVLCSLWFFGIGALVIYSIVLFIILRKYYNDLSRKYRILLEATNQIAEGDLDVTIAEDLGVFEPFKTELQRIQSGFKVAVDEEVKSQKMKTDLITNMSHDLKTPLTAIITYVNLLKENHVTEEQQKAYINILEQKSMRLKSLIEDLFEISKANSNNVMLNLVNVDIVSLLKEVSLELSDKIEESSIDFRWNLPDEKIILALDSQKTYRIFDNLLTNIIKYGMPSTRAYVDMKREDDFVVITMKNISASELTFNPEEITDRFVRGDQARNTEGSGLGMAIAKSFVELQKGKMNVEVEADLFRVIIRWPIQELNCS